MKACASIIFLLLTHLGDPSYVSALQTHGGPEGLYVHQGAHLFLIFSLVIFLLNIRRFRLVTDKAWILLSWGAFLLALWSVWAFIGHEVEIFIPSSSFVMLPESIIPSLALDSWKEVIYYILKMDHLLCLPAILCLYGGLKKLHAGFTEDPTNREEP